MRFIYALLTYLLLPAFLVHLLWRSRLNPEYRQRIGERFGFGMPRLNRDSIWIHAVSVGEVQAAAALIRELQARHPDTPLVVTTMTPTGSARVLELFGERVAHSYLPYDAVSSVRRFLDWSRPQLAIIMETELWPNLYNECGSRNIPLVLASARVSPRSVRGYRRLVSLFKETLSHGIVIAAQTSADAERFRSLGASSERTHVTGNIKFDFELPADTTALGSELRSAHAPDRPVWIAASTHEGEEAQVLAAHELVLQRQPDALLLLVPRHPERFEAVADEIGATGMPYVTRSSGVVCAADTKVFLGDSMGELTTLYAAADVAFVGGSLVAIGGHNLLEPAALSIPVVAGPHNFNAADIAELFSESGAVELVSDAESLAASVLRLLNDPDERARRGSAGQRVVAGNRGALKRLLKMLQPLLPASASG